jgi:tRNA-specific 2-thiouridylase
MGETGEKINALSLLSGGLDSQLAICVLMEQGIHVEAITFESPFFSAVNARKAADGLGVTIHVVDFTTEIIGLLANPKHGFGAEMNPCIDCHALMIRRAGELMKEMGFHFLSTGEVLNQRPMSQNRQSLDV